MFVNNLNPRQQECLLGLSKLLVEADGSLSEKESEILAVIESQCETSVAVVEDPLSALGEYFEDNSSKVALMLELVGIAYADSEYHEAEQALIKKIAGLLNVSFDLLSDIEKWVERQFALVQEAKELMGV